MKALYTLIGLIAGLVIGIFIPRPALPKEENIHNLGHMVHMPQHTLGTLQGDAFDQAFLKEMIVHHEGALDMASQALVRSSRQEIRSLAQDIIVSQDREIKLMQSWFDQWFSEENS